MQLWETPANFRTKQGLNRLTFAVEAAYPLPLCMQEAPGVWVAGIRVSLRIRAVMA